MRNKFILVTAILFALGADGMHKYDVKVQNNGTTFVESIKAQSSNDARKVMEQKYPKGRVLNVHEDKEKDATAS